MEDENADRVYVPGTNGTEPDRDVEPFWPPEELNAPVHGGKPVPHDAPPAFPLPPTTAVTLLAEALGCAGLRCETKEEVDDVIRRAMEINDRPVVIDFVVGKDAQVWPMVGPGASNDEVMAARGIRPLFEEDEVTPQ